MHPLDAAWRKAEIHAEALRLFAREDELARRRVRPKFEYVTDEVLKKLADGLDKKQVEEVTDQLENMVYAARKAHAIAAHFRRRPQDLKAFYYALYGRKPNTLALEKGVFSLNLVVPQKEFALLPTQIQNRYVSPQPARVNPIIPASVRTKSKNPKRKQRTSEMRRLRKHFTELFGVGIPYLTCLLTVGYSNSPTTFLHEDRHVASSLKEAHERLPADEVNTRLIQVSGLPEWKFELLAPQGYRSRSCLDRRYSQAVFGTVRYPCMQRFEEAYAYWPTHGFKTIARVLAGAYWQPKRLDGAMTQEQKTLYGEYARQLARINRLQKELAAPPEVVGELLRTNDLNEAIQVLEHKAKLVREAQNGFVNGVLNGKRVDAKKPVVTRV